MDRTEVSQIFKKLVLKDHMIRYGQRDYIFSFKTVFHISKYLSYRWCLCAYEHENFDYISETGQINHEMFQKIVESIRTGDCPHVSMVSKEYVSETNVYGIHIVAAVGSEEKILSYLKHMDHKLNQRSFNFGKECEPLITGKFAQTPYSIALLKNKPIVAYTEYDVFKEILSNRMIPDHYELCTVIHGKRDSKNSENPKVKTSITDRNFLTAAKYGNV